jgi:hypothetical protein
VAIWPTPKACSSKLVAVSRDAAAAIGAVIPEILRAENPTDLACDMPTNVGAIRRIALPGSSLFQILRLNTSVGAGNTQNVRKPGSRPLALVGVSLAQLQTRSDS